MGLIPLKLLIDLQDKTWEHVFVTGKEFEPKIQGVYIPAVHSFKKILFLSP